MPSGKAFLKHNLSGVSQDVIVTWAEHDNPNAEINRQFYAAPHSQRDLTVANLNPVMHIFKFWTTTNGTTLDTLLDLNVSIDCSIYNENIVYPLKFTVGTGEPGVPNDGDFEYHNADLADAEYQVFKPGYGLLEWGVNIEKIETGGFRIIDGAPFSEDEVYSMWIFRTVAQQVNTTTTGGDYTLANLTAGMEFSGSDLGKHFLAKSSATILPVIFPANIPNGKVKFSTFTGVQRYLKLTFASVIDFNGQKLSVWLAKNESIELRFVGGLPIVESYTGNYNMIGMLVPSRMAFQNTIEANGAAYSKNDLGRFYEDYIQLLPASQIVTDLATWNKTETVLIGTQVKTKYPNKGKFCIVGDTVYVPDHRDVSIKFYASNTMVAGIGALEHEQIGKHAHAQKGSKDGGNNIGYSLDFNNDLNGQNVPLNTHEVGGDAQRVDSHSMVPLYII